QLRTITCLAPRAWPGRLAWFGGFPQREVLGAAVADDIGFALFHFFDAVARQGAVVGAFGVYPGSDIKVDRGFSCIGKATVNKAVHVIHHLGNKASGAWLYRRRQHTKGVISLGKFPLVGRNPLPPRAVVLGSLI